MHRTSSTTDAFPPRPVLQFSFWLQNPARHVFGNPLARHFLKQLTDECPICGTSVIMSEVTASMGGGATSKCKRCERLKRSLSYFQSLAKIFTHKDLLWEPLLAFPVGRGIKANDPQAFSRAIQVILKGIATYGMRRPLTTSAPLTFFWEFTGRCNLNCLYCYARDKRVPSDELTTEECLRLIDDLSEANVVSVTFSGGEPLMRKDFFEVASYAAKKGLVVFLATNGTLIERDTARKLREIGVEYAEISIDSARREVHDAFRGLGTFDKAVNAVTYCVEEGIPLVGIATTLTTKNEAIDETLEFAKELGANQVVFLNYVPTRGAKGNPELDLDPYEREKAIKRILETQKNYMCFKRVTILQATYAARISNEMAREKGSGLKQIGFIDVDEPQMSRLFNFMGGCGAARTMAAMTPNGDITPCTLLPLKLGNVREDKFIDVWTNSPVLADLRDRKNWKGRCGRCRYKIVCGGARCRAYAYFGDCLASDPACTLNADLLVAEGRKLSTK
jgi:radical SAM protein with 4Fe4S-binding SPASM domain